MTLVFSSTASKLNYFVQHISLVLVSAPGQSINSTVQLSLLILSNVVCTADLGWCCESSVSVVSSPPSLPHRGPGLQHSLSTCRLHTPVVHPSLSTCLHCHGNDHCCLATCCRPETCRGRRVVDHLGICFCYPLSSRGRNSSHRRIYHRPTAITLYIDILHTSPLNTNTKHLKTVGKEEVILANDQATY